MKKIKGISIFIIVISLICSFSLVAFAYSTYATASVSPDGDDIYFYGIVECTADAQYIDTISYWTESCYQGAAIASYDKSYDDQSHNEISSQYTKENAADGLYSKEVQGFISYMPPIQYTDDPDDSDSYNKTSSKSLNSVATSEDKDEVKEFLDNLDKDMIKDLDINIKNYRKIQTAPGFIEDEYKTLKLAYVKTLIPREYGDTIPSIYLNEDNTKGILLTQDLEGIYYLYEFEADKNSQFGWQIGKTKKVQGEYKAMSDYFIKNPNPPTYKEESNGNKVKIVIQDNN